MVTRRDFLAGSAVLGLSACRAPSAIVRDPRRVELTLDGVPTVEGAGVRLHRVIGQARLRNLDPFVLLDRFDSDRPADYVRGFPDHPHRGFETVTLMLGGRMRHRDSVGNHGVIGGGGAQWMTAGRGIVHSEMPDQSEGLLSGFQLWVNLPAHEKMCAPYYQDLDPTRLATGALGSGGHLHVVAGAVDGLTGPVRERPTAPLLVTAALEDDRPLTVDTPRGHAAFVFVSAGEITIGADQAVPAGTIAVLGDGDHVRLAARGLRSELLLAAGRPLREPIVQRGPFVMNTQAEIEQAFADYRAGVLVQG
jgi:redox-sensitive bicupin YhaK (pirin superfamily)